jgi:hypothetical protein
MLGFSGGPDRRQETQPEPTPAPQHRQAIGPGKKRATWTRTSKEPTQIR